MVAAVVARDLSFQGYRIERMLGHGGMGVVYEAVQSSLDRRVALKVLRPDLASDEAFVRRFRREAEIQASIEHPHVLDVYEVGTGREEGLFLAMRLVEGPTLDRLIRAGELDGERTLLLLGQVAGALDAAHEAGLLHRDVKPQNVLVGEGDHAFLADFSLSRAGSDQDTGSRPMLGTVAYVAPEIIRGEAPGPAADRYAFAATLFHCLTGDVVFPLGSDAAVLFAHLNEPVPSISERRRELPASLDSVFAAALAKDPADRPGSAQALIADVRERMGAGVASLGPAAIGAGLPKETTPTPIPHATTLPPSKANGGSQAQRSRRTRIVSLAGVGLAGLALGVAAFALLDDGAAPGATVPVPAVAAGAEALGSDLDTVDRTVDCLGGEPGAGSKPCSIAQSELPGAQLLVPADGMIVGWAVSGARGEVALDVIRPRGEDTVRVGLSQWESVGNTAPHRFRTALPVERGDLLGIQLAPGAAVGVAETDDAETQRWIAPADGFYGSPTRGPGTGFDYELAVRADFVAGAVLESPERLTGREARRAPDGLVRRLKEVEISKPEGTVDVALTEVGDRVALDLFVSGDRRERLFVPGLEAGGMPIAMESAPVEGEEFGGVGVFWVNPNSGRRIYHGFTVSRSQIRYLG